MLFIFKINRLSHCQNPHLPVAHPLPIPAKATVVQLSGDYIPIVFNKGAIFAQLLEAELAFANVPTSLGAFDEAANPYYQESVRYNAACGAAVEAAAWCQSLALLQQLQEDWSPWKWLREQ